MRAGLLPGHGQFGDGGLNQLGFRVVGFAPGVAVRHVRHVDDVPLPVACAKDRTAHSLDFFRINTCLRLEYFFEEVGLALEQLGVLADDLVHILLALLKGQGFDLAVNLVHLLNALAYHGRQGLHGPCRTGKEAAAKRPAALICVGCKAKGPLTELKQHLRLRGLPVRR